MLIKPLILKNKVNAHNQNAPDGPLPLAKVILFAYGLYSSLETED